ncbi:MAG: hypothetical protein KF718_08575 [Polyangiaceae bacterium]|nr:hypothetical protein [Polyangiaceae bacterium]
MTRKDSDPELSALLQALPVASKTEDEWEALAVRIEARVAEAQQGGDDLALLAAPLPPSGDEPSADASTRPPPRSLAELARESLRAMAEQPEEDLARDALSVASTQRASQPVIADSVRHAAARIAVQASTPPPVASVASSPTVHVAPAPERRRSVAPWVGAGLGLGGLLIALAIVLGAQLRQPAPVAEAPASPIAAADAPPPSAPEQPPPAPSDPEVLTPEQLGAGPTAGAAGARAQAHGKTRPGAPAQSVALAEPAPTAEPEPPATAPAPAPKVTADPDEKNLKPAAQPTDVPHKPSIGAANAAISAVLGSARACVAGHSEPSRATLTFGSDGRVTAVAVAGPAAGTGAEGCIRSALSKARVERFASPSFTMSVTVRP